jgi:hypothetical protein
LCCCLLSGHRGKIKFTCNNVLGKIMANPHMVAILFYVRISDKMYWQIKYIQTPPKYGKAFTNINDSSLSLLANNDYSSQFVAFVLCFLHSTVL